MLPLYKRGMRYAAARPYLRMKRQAVVSGLVALVLLYALFGGFSSDNTTVPAVEDGVGHPAIPPVDQAVPKATPFSESAEHAPVAPSHHHTVSPGEKQADDGGIDTDAEAETAGVEQPATPKEGEQAKGGEESGEKTPQAPLLVRLLLPLVAGFCFGFLGSVPIAGPTSAMVLKLGIQGKYRAGLTIAFGGAISEATYAGIAFWGFGSFLAGAKFLLPVSKVLGAIMFTLIGLVFLRADMKPSLDPDVEASQRKGVRRPQGEVLKNILMGLTMSGINPALLASYTGAIASVYGTGMLEFTLFLAVVFAVGVCCGVSTWFYLLLSLLKKYKQRLKNHTIDIIMRGLGCFLLTLGLLCAKSSLDYFMSTPPETK